MLAVLLYGSETWVLKATHVRRLSSFHNRCVRIILGISRHQQWQQKLSTKVLAERFGMSWSIVDLVMEKRLKWLGHLARMNPERLPKKILFAELKKKRPSHGTKRRWRDLVSSDLAAMGVKDQWYQLCQDRKAWYDLCSSCRSCSQSAEKECVCS